MHQALYRKWRPVDFNDVCGQDHITSILKYEVANGKTTHAYLFCGSRGTGKTTCAKILSKAVNCEHPVNGNPCNKCNSCISIDSGIATDVYEMDAASNNGIDNIRDIRDEVLYSPSELKNRVYIIDEVHMLSPSAFNALLKTLEEPPENVVFILATTETQKIPATILSRCQRFDFRRIPTKTIADRLVHIANEEGFKVESDAAFLIAKLAQGGMRDAISMLELCSGEHEEITTEVVINTTGINSRRTVVDTVNSILNKDYEAILKQINELYTSSIDIIVFWNDLLSFYRDIFVVKNTKNAKDYLDVTEGEYEELVDFSSKITNAVIASHINQLEETFNAMQRPNASKRICAEMALIRMCDNRLSFQADALSERIAALEDKLMGIDTIPSPVTEPRVIESVKQEAPRVVNETKKEEPTRASEAKPETKTEPVKDEKNTAKPSSENTEKPVLKALTSWPEVVKKYSRTDISTSTFLGMSYAYRSGTNIVIRVPGTFTYDVVSQTDVKEKLASLIGSAEGTPVRLSDIKVEINADKPIFDSESGIDEIIENAK
ncbi:MAG: DNA polymerase III subunit gamma/tau [Clostridia bacterium]|nr:DNA polymerase III subunit gamma/tau [Clostridia bacterium]